MKKDQYFNLEVNLLNDDNIASMMSEMNAAEAQGEVTERTDSHFPLRHDSQQKKSIKGKLCGLSTALDTLFLMALTINKGKWLLVAFLPI